MSLMTTVNRLNLLEILKKNRENHKKLYETAHKIYLEKCIELLTKKLEAFKAGKGSTHKILIPVPEDHTKEYDLVIQMFEMSVDENITMDTTQFRNFVQDNWSWSERFYGKTYALYSNYGGTDIDVSEMQEYPALSPVMGSTSPEDAWEEYSE